MWPILLDKYNHSWNIVFEWNGWEPKSSFKSPYNNVVILVTQKQVTIRNILYTLLDISPWNWNTVFESKLICLGSTTHQWILETYQSKTNKKN